jgi:hypothetical protein
MSSSSTPTGVHYALVVGVLVSIVCSLGWLMAYKGTNSISELERRARGEEKRREEQSKIVRDLEADIQHIKNLLDSQYSEIGSESTPGTLLWDIRQHITNSGGDESDTYHGMILKLVELKRNAALSRDKLQEQLETERIDYQRQVAELNARLGVEMTARESANRDKTTADIAYQETNTKREAEIVELRKTMAAAREHAEEEQLAAEQMIQKLDRRIANLNIINDRLKIDLELKSSPNFERANGEIRWVDHNSKRVWISLGKADGLKPRATFSVYQKPHSGVGHGTDKGLFGPKDLKGAIEITRVVKSDLSEARIVGENLYRPISRGDSIYSPIWSSGRGEAFSLVGIMDLDGDGHDDRDLLLAQIHTAGGIVDNDVDGNGALRVNGFIPADGKPRINEKTKFVVIGKLPEAARSADPTVLAANQKLLGLRKDLEDTARERGVRVLSLGDFLNYIGYVPKRRLSVPGNNPRQPSPKPNSPSAAGGKSPAPTATRTPNSKNPAGVKVFRQ